MILHAHICMNLNNLVHAATKSMFDVCVTVHHIWKRRAVPTWCNNYDLLS